MLFASMLPEAEEINVEVSEGVRFIDAGANFSAVTCPLCGAELSIEWWGNVMNAAWGGSPNVDIFDPYTGEELLFTDLMVSTPCCGSHVSLNDLKYDWPQGFARFSLEALYPDSTGLENQQLLELEQVLGCNLRQIWVHI